MIRNIYLLLIPKLHFTILVTESSIYVLSFYVKYLLFSLDVCLSHLKLN